MESLRKTVRKRIRVENPLSREMLAECLGTCILVTIGCGSIAQLVLAKGDANGQAWIGLNLAWGFGIAFGAYICGNVTGGHLNPAISFMMYVLGNLTLLKVLLYSLAQTIGAFLGAGIVYFTYYDALNNKYSPANKDARGIFGTFPAENVRFFGGLLDQIVGTALLGLIVCVVTDKRNKIPGHLGPLLVGFGVATIGMSYGVNCGFAINPARDFGPRLFSLIAGYEGVFSHRNYMWFWIPIVGPLIGALVGAWVYKLFVGLHWPRDDADIELSSLKNRRQPAEDVVLIKST